MEGRRKKIARASIDWFIGLFGVPNVLLGAAALIWDIPPWIVFVVPLGTGALGFCIGAYDGYKSTGKEMLEAQANDKKIDLIVRDLQEKHDLATSPDFTAVLPSLISSNTTHRQVRRTRRNPASPLAHSHASSPAHPSPLSSSRATTVNIMMDSLASPSGVQLDFKRGGDGGLSFYARASDSPGTPGMYGRSLTAPDALIPEHETGLAELTDDDGDVKEAAVTESPKRKLH